MSAILDSNSFGAIITGLASAFIVISPKTQFLDEVKINTTSQLISGIFKLLQKLLKYSVEQQLQFHFYQLYLHHNLLHQHQNYKFFL